MLAEISKIVVPEAQAAISGAVIAKAIDPIIVHIVNPIIGFLFAVAIFFFIYGLVELIAKADSKEGRDKGKWHIIGGAFGMFIMASAWGIIALISNTVGEL